MGLQPTGHVRRPVLTLRLPRVESRHQLQERPSSSGLGAVQLANGIGQLYRRAFGQYGTIHYPEFYEKGVTAKLFYGPPGLPSASPSTSCGTLPCCSLRGAAAAEEALIVERSSTVRQALTSVRSDMIEGRISRDEAAKRTWRSWARSACNRSSLRLPSIR